MVRLLCLQARLHLLQDSGEQQRQGLARRLVCGLQNGLAGCRQDLAHGFSHHSAGELRHPELGFRTAEHFINAGELAEIDRMHWWHSFHIWYVYSLAPRSTVSLMPAAPGTLCVRAHIV